MTGCVKSAGGGSIHLGVGLIEANEEVINDRSQNVSAIHRLLVDFLAALSLTHNRYETVWLSNFK